MRAWKPSEAGSWMGERPRLQSRLLAGPPGSRSSPRAVDPPTLAWAWPIQGPGFFLYPCGSCVSDISCFQVFVRSAWLVFKICSPWLGAKF